MRERLLRAWQGSGVSAPKRIGLGLLSAAVAAGLVCLGLQFVFVGDVPSRAPKELSDRAKKLAAYHLALWTEGDSRALSIARMRQVNAEWDFMGRTFVVLALADVARREPERREDCLAVIDYIIDETLRLEKEKGLYHFLMDYARSAPFVQQPPRSLFLDGEIALMLGVRQLLEERPDYARELITRIDLIADRMAENPVLCGESYPDECWMFCNAIALAAIRVSDVLDGRDHSAFITRWLETAKEKLVDPKTGLLVSSFTLKGDHLGGPEGSSIWMACHCLRLVDEEFARDQYERARHELAVNAFGLAYAREWPTSWQGPMDVDSGPVIPGLGASPSSSGLFMLAAASFGDVEQYRKLSASIEVAGLPTQRDGKLYYAAGNQVGNAVIFYSAVVGATWEAVLLRSPTP